MKGEAVRLLGSAPPRDAQNKPKKERYANECHSTKTKINGKPKKKKDRKQKSTRDLLKSCALCSWEVFFSVGQEKRPKRKMRN